MRTKNPSYIVTTYIEKGETVLDLGCGYGEPFVDSKFKLLVGVDAWKKVFKLSEYDLVIYENIKKIGKLFAESSFDVVTAIDVIEHLPKEDGFKLIKDMERIAKKKVLIFTPKIWTENRDSFENPVYWSYGNKNYNLHRSLWTEKDFIELGYDFLRCQEGYILAGKLK